MIPTQFESLKDLLKEIAEAEAADPSNLRKRVTSTPYQGPDSQRVPASMRHIQAWMVGDQIATDDAKNCRRNRNPPFTQESIGSLLKLFKGALTLFRQRDASGGNAGYGEASEGGAGC